jgi:LysM repeat protein
MSFWIRFLSGALAVWLGFVLSGCSPSGNSQLDEEKEPHFVLGQSRVNAMDYNGAIEAFQESLEADPHSAAAHFNLAWLYDEKEPDPAAAIYHYEQYLKLRPNAENADVVRGRIEACKQQLARDVLALPSTPAAQRQLEQLMEQNRELQDELNKWRAYANQLAALLKTNSLPQNNSTPQTSPNPVQTVQTVTQPTEVAGSNHSANTAARNPAPRTHTVVAGETPIAIARKYGVKLDALMAANPGLDPRHMRVGQVLNLPPPQ